MLTVESLRCADTGCQRTIDYRPSARLLWAMAHSEDDRKALGQRLAAARNLAGFTLQSAADALTQRGFPVKKGTVGAWETGRNVPDALWVRRLARLYNVSADALLWAESLSPDAMKIAAEFDHMSEEQGKTWRMLWLGFITGAAQGGEQLPMAPRAEPAVAPNHKSH